MIIDVYLQEIKQPVGVFYIGKMSSKHIIAISRANPRSEGTGVQRDESMRRRKEIAMYCEDPDATFPTPIILSLPSNDNTKLSKTDLTESADIYKFTIDTSKGQIADVLDGQHRIGGISASNIDIDLPIVVAFNLTKEQKAYIFATINGNQTTVPKTLVYDLFELSRHRSPNKSCHEIARIMNSSEKSPFKGRLKMLPKRTDAMQTLSQGTFVTILRDELISSIDQRDTIDIKKGKKLQPDDKMVLRKYFINDQDEVIVKILLNCFNAVKEVFPQEWDDPNNFILTKSTGYSAIIKSLRTLIPVGEKMEELSKQYFVGAFSKFKEFLSKNNKKLTSDFYSSNAAGEGKLAEDIIRSQNNI